MTLKFLLNKTPSFIFGYLSDMQKFASIHPVISKIDKTGKDSYLVHETLKFGFIPFSFRYPVILNLLAEENKVTFQATVFKMTRIKMQFSLEKDAEYTKVSEQIDIKTPLPITWLLKKTFK